MEESEFHMLIKHCFVMGRNQRWLERCCGDSCLLLILNKVVWTERTGCPKSTGVGEVRKVVL